VAVYEKSDIGRDFLGHVIHHPAEAMVVVSQRSSLIVPILISRSRNSPRKEALVPLL
jgi:hypothetical protein